MPGHGSLCPVIPLPNELSPLFIFVSVSTKTVEQDNYKEENESAKCWIGSEQCVAGF